MAEREEYMLSKPAEWIDEVFKGAVVGTKAMPELSEQFKAQFRDNIGATSSDASWQPKGYFDTVEELQATVTAPKPGDAYGVGLEPPYNIWVWDGLRGRWLDNGPIKGMDGKNGKDGEDGKDGSDANVTAENIIAALGYTPADAENVGVPDGSIGTAQLANGAVTQEKLADNIELGITMTKVWENASPTSNFGDQTVYCAVPNDGLILVQYMGKADMRGEKIIGIFQIKPNDECMTSAALMLSEVGSYFVIGARRFWVRSDFSGIAFGNGFYKPKDSTDCIWAQPQLMIPQCIYVIKRVK